MNVCAHCGRNRPSSCCCDPLERRARWSVRVAVGAGLLGLVLLGVGLVLGVGVTPMPVLGIGAAVLAAIGLWARSKLQRSARASSDHLEWCDGIRPYAPLSTLRPVADGIWSVDGPVVKMSVGPLSLPFPTRMVVIRLRSGGLWLWSPTAPTPELFAEIDALGHVEHLVSPNKVHYAAIPAWKERYPRATSWASPGVRERARSQKIDVAFDADLGDDAPPSWASDIEQLVFRGSRFLEEVVFFHRRSSTLILADLVMALERERVRPPLLRWLFDLVGATSPGRTPRELQATFWGRRSQARACYQHILRWQPRRLIVAHGRCHLDDATAQLERAFSWLRLRV